MSAYRVTWWDREGDPHHARVDADEDLRAFSLLVDEVRVERELESGDIADLFDLARHRVMWHRRSCPGRGLLRHFCSCDHPVSVYACPACGEPLAFDAADWCEHALECVDDPSLPEPTRYEPWAA